MRRLERPGGRERGEETGGDAEETRGHGRVVIAFYKHLDCSCTHSAASAATLQRIWPLFAASLVEGFFVCHKSSFRAERCARYESLSRVGIVSIIQDTLMLFFCYLLPPPFPEKSQKHSETQTQSLVDATGFYVYNSSKAKKNIAFLFNCVSYTELLLNRSKWAFYEIGSNSVALGSS